MCGRAAGVAVLAAAQGRACSARQQCPRLVPPCFWINGNGGGGGQIRPSRKRGRTGEVAGSWVGQDERSGVVGRSRTATDVSEDGLRVGVPKKRGIPTTRYKYCPPFAWEEGALARCGRTGVTPSPEPPRGFWHPARLQIRPPSRVRRLELEEAQAVGAWLWGSIPVLDNREPRAALALGMETVRILGYQPG